MHKFTTVALSLNEWTTRAQQHAALIQPYADAFVQRRSTGAKHPVHDFLFTYYGFSPAKLKQWVPSISQKLIVTPSIKQEYPWFIDYWFKMEQNELFLNVEQLQANVKGVATFIAELCKNIADRPPRFGCFGLHEWAMVYKLSQDEIRHKDHPLRLSPEVLATFVESQKLKCTHYDAYRFFTKDALPLNTLNPTLATRLQMEQGGCVHANMDLYKWSMKLWPWIGSDFIAKTFFYALECRELDMRASPYNLAADGYAPICIETEEGRKQYQKAQQSLAEKAVSLRKELQNFCEKLLETAGTEATAET